MSLKDGYILSISSLLLAFFTTVTEAQSLKSDGISIGGGFQALSWSFDEGDYITETGYGFSLNVGYNVRPSLGIFIGVDGSEVYNGPNDWYDVGHFDVGVELRLIELASGYTGSDSRAKPYFRFSYTRLNMINTDPFGAAEVKASGLGVGVGTYLFVSDNLTIDIGYIGGMLGVNEFKRDDSLISSDDMARSGRLKLGVTFHISD
ncbi:MAG: outer membrane beta-barrel protein [Bacteroidota bacterium]|nr:outer membrane beta-barrel protein [Bacteroidota bacterium]